MTVKVCKFGGTSMADGNTIMNVAGIIRKDETRRYVVVSAPGTGCGPELMVPDLL